MSEAESNRSNTAAVLSAICIELNQFYNTSVTDVGDVGLRCSVEL